MCVARRSASRAVSSGTPEISNKTRPGFTTATQYSNVPFPEPIIKQSAIDTARESERGVIDIETLQKTQANLIETLEETLQIQSEGRRQRALAEQELQAMELDLRDKLLQITAEQKQQEANRTQDDNYQF